MVKIRLARIGRKQRPSYRIVVSDSRKTTQADRLADLGYYDPLTENCSINEEEAILWLNRGAVPSDSVKSLLKKQGVYQHWIDSKHHNKEGE